MVSDGFDFGLDRVRHELGDLAAATGSDGQPHEGHGEAADGLVRVTAVDGRLSTVEVNPRAMRLASQDLAEAFALAANAALDDLAAKYPAVDVPTIDPARLEAQLADVQQEGLRQMRRYTESITDALRQLGGR